MNNIFEKLTNNMSESIESAVSLALHNKNQEVEPVHFLWAQLTNSNSVLNQMFNKMSIDKVAIELDVKSLSEKLPKSSSISKENIKLSRNFTQIIHLKSFPLFLVTFKCFLFNCCFDLIGQKSVI